MQRVRLYSNATNIANYPSQILVRAQYSDNSLLLSVAERHYGAYLYDSMGAAPAPTEVTITTHSVANIDAWLASYIQP